MTEKTIDKLAEQYEYTNGTYGFKQAVEYCKKIMYSEEDLKKAFFNGGNMKDMEEFKHWFAQFKKRNS
jgi:predicted metal-dependent phosphoesterase TrpH